MEYFVGIDPGKTGALAIVNGNNHAVCVLDYSENEKSFISEVKAVLECVYPELVAIELVRSAPGQGVASTFKFGANWGFWRGLILGLGYAIIDVRPQTWYAKHRLRKKTSKSDKPSLELARERYPNIDLKLQKHNGRADALLLADYARIKHLNRWGI